MKPGLFFLLAILSFLSCKGQNAYLNLQPLSIAHANIGVKAADISFLLEKPAGKSGFITIKDGKLLKADGGWIICG